MMNKKDKQSFEAMAKFFDNASQRSIEDARASNNDKEIQDLEKYSKLFQHRAMLCRSVRSLWDIPKDKKNGSTKSRIVYPNFIKPLGGKN